MASPTMSELTGAFDVLNRLIEQTNDQNKLRMEQYGLTEDFCKHVGSMSEEEIENLTLSQVNSHLAQYGVDSGNIRTMFAKSDNTMSSIEKWKEFFAELRKAVRDMDESLTTREELQQAIDEVYAAQAEFLKSTEYKDAYIEKLEKIRSLAENEPDEVRRKEYVKKLDGLQKSKNLSFLLDRLDSPVINKKNPNKELERLVNIFFDKNRSSFLMERYLTNAQKLGLNPQYHVNLYDIEEKFLPEPYYPLNNFFLFVVMSYIAYIDTNDEIERLYAITVLSMMGNLLMDGLDKSDVDLITGIIRNIENRILVHDDVVEKFKSDNTTWKEHPIRKELEAQRAEMKYRLELIDEIKGLLNGFGANLTDGTRLTAKNASTVLRSMDTKQIEGIRDDVKAEVDRRKAETEGANLEEAEDESTNDEWESIAESAADEAGTAGEEDATEGANDSESEESGGD